MSHKPEISVILPVYNGGAYLPEAVESILGQTFTDFEFLIIDDGSTDATLEVLRGFEKRDARIRLQTRENRGLVPTLNELVAMARGNWIARMDADDISLPNRLARQLEWLADTGADVCGSWVRRFGGGDNRLVRLYESDNAIRTELFFYSPFAHPSVMFRASLAKVLPYDDKWIKAEDYDFWIRAAEAGWKMSNVPETLLLYRVHESQVSARDAEFQQQQGHKIRRRYWEYRFREMNLDPENLEKGLEIYSSPAAAVDMDAVDALFSTLLSASDAEARPIILGHLARRYRLAAADAPGIVSRWSKMNRAYGSSSGLATRVHLFLFRLLRIREGGLLFKWFRALHKWRMAR